MIEAVARIQFDSAELHAQHPPKFTNPHKRALYDKIVRPFSGTLSVARWRGTLPPLIQLASRTIIEVYEDVFTYGAAEPGTIPWHLNFADRALFGYYGSSLLAQDEHQVLEHPILGSVREALLSLQVTKPQLAPLTRDTEPTPITIAGVPRSLHFDTVNGPYGNAFAHAPLSTILTSAHFLEHPTISNIVALEAPSGGRGTYTRGEIADVLHTAFTGFTACKLESGSAQALIHTGNWGCGAFGGNPTLMALLQVSAAWFAGLKRVIYHTVSHRGASGIREAMPLLDKLVSGSTVDTTGFIKAVESLRFQWGVPDGN